LTFLFAAALVLVGCTGSATSFTPRLVLPGSTSALGFDVGSTRTEGAREFVVTVPDTLLGADSPHCWHSVDGATGRDAVKSAHVGSHWVFTFREPVDVAWAATFWIVGPSEPIGERVFKRDVFTVPLAAFVVLDPDELERLRSAKQLVLQRSLPSGDASARRGILVGLRGIANLGGDSSGRTQVTFVDGTEALVPIQAHGRQVDRTSIRVPA
jgi:hypothetical protein